MWKAIHSLVVAEIDDLQLLHVAHLLRQRLQLIGMQEQHSGVLPVPHLKASEGETKQTGPQRFPTVCAPSAQTQAVAVCTARARLPRGEAGRGSCDLRRRCGCRRTGRWRRATLQSHWSCSQVHQAQSACSEGALMSWFNEVRTVYRGCNWYNKQRTSSFFYCVDVVDSC